jgi:hypothetical protein
MLDHRSEKEIACIRAVGQMSAADLARFPNADHWIASYRQMFPHPWYVRLARLLRFRGAH